MRPSGGRRRPCAVRDARILAGIRQMRAEYEEVYGARKTWLELNRRGIPVARCTVERVMRQDGLRGARRGRTMRTTIPGKGPGHERAADLIGRDFTAPAPDRRWVADFTHVATLAGTVYVAFVVDIFSRMFAGWAAARHKRAKLVLDALDMALWHRDHGGHPVSAGLIHHSDAGALRRYPMTRRSDPPCGRSCSVSRWPPYTGTTRWLTSGASPRLRSRVTCPSRRGTSARLPCGRWTRTGRGRPRGRARARELAGRAGLAGLSGSGRACRWSARTATPRSRWLTSYRRRAGRLRPARRPGQPASQSRPPAA